MKTIIVIGLFLIQAYSVCTKNVLSFEKMKFLEGKTAKQSFHLPGDFNKVGNVNESLSVLFFKNFNSRRSWITL